MTSSSVLRTPGDLRSDSVIRRLRWYIKRVPLISRPYGYFLQGLALRRQEHALKTLEPIQKVEFFGVAITLELENMHDFLMFEKFRLGEVYEAGTCRILLNQLRPGGTFIDIGANNGYFSVLASSIVGATGRVVAIEPQPDAVRRLHNNITLNSCNQNVEIHQVAVGVGGPTTHMSVDNFEDGRSSLVYGGGKKIVVPLVPLDDILGNLSPNLLKIDVEGYELEVLESAARTLAGTPAPKLIVEWTGMHNSSRLWRFLSSRYNLFRISDQPDDVGLRSVRRLDELNDQCNLLCVTKDQSSQQVTKSS